MRRALAAAAMFGGFLVVASADSTTPFSLYGGYFSSRTFTGHGGFDTHLGGFEVGAQDSLLSLPIFGSASIGASVVFGDSLGGGSAGNLYRVHLDYKTATFPGSGLYGIGAVSYNYATGSDFSSQSGLGLEVGIGLPIKLGLPIGPGAAIEARYRFLGPSAATGFSVGLNVSF